MNKNENRNLFDLWSKGAPVLPEQNKTAFEVQSHYDPGFSDIEVEGWLSVASPIFKDESKFPIFTYPQGETEATGDLLTDKKYMRINEKYKEPALDATGKNVTAPGDPPLRQSFWFRLSKEFLYFTENAACMNVLGSVAYTKVIEPKSIHFIDPLCFVMIELTGNNWQYCGKTNEDAKKFICKIQKNTKQTPDPFCLGAKPDVVLKQPPPKAGDIVEKVITQPYILIPLAREMCNENWNYAAYGRDWKCLCKEGLEQSPVDLPPTHKAIGSPVKALFNFEQINNIADEDFEDYVKQGENIKLEYNEGALRIFASYLGKTVTMDGGVYHAQQISFHSPSQHTISGEQFALEMQVTHAGKTVGDTAKQLILSFVFKKSPGIYNKFIEPLDIFNLPNPLDKSRDLEKKIFLPNIFFTVNEDEPASMIPFSFYTYQGSLLQPPCNEKTIHYVASEPIGISSTVLELFKEALRIPDLQDANGGVSVSENSIMHSNRAVQKLNGRPVFYYDHKKYNCPTFKRMKRGYGGAAAGTHGHYERKESEMTNYFYVESGLPSGLPGAFVVTEKEAMGNSNPN